MDKDKIRQKIQEEIDRLPENERKLVLERRAKRAEESAKFLRPPEEMLAEIDARCEALKKAGLYDADKIEEDLREKMIESNERVDLLRGRTSK